MRAAPALLLAEEAELGQGSSSAPWVQKSRVSLPRVFQAAATVWLKVLRDTGLLLSDDSENCPFVEGQGAVLGPGKVLGVEWPVHMRRELSLPGGCR